MKQLPAAVPSATTVHALGKFVQDRAEEGVQRLLRSIPAEQHDAPDAVELLRIPRTLGQAAQATADELKGELLDPQPNPDLVQALWRILLNTARPFRDHPALPAGVREALPAADEAQPTGR